MSDKPIDPYWWCRHDEKLAKLFWERVERPLLLEKFREFDDPKFREPPPKKGFTLVEAIVVVAILLTLVGLLWPAISAARAAAKRSSDGVELAAVEPPRTFRLWTGQHDGHWWVMSPEHFEHHPDCPCMSRKAEEER